MAKIARVPRKLSGSMARWEHDSNIMYWDDTVGTYAMTLRVSHINDTNRDTYYVMQTPTGITYPINLVDFMKMVSSPRWAVGVYTGLVDFVEEDTDIGKLYSIKANLC